MALANISKQPVKDDRESRIHLSAMVIKLFDHWKLSVSDASDLLGLASVGRTTISRYRKGEPLATNRDLQERVGHLLAIHQSLRILFPRNREMVYGWPTAPNKAFGGISPIQYMKEQGFIGVAEVRRYLDFQRGQ